MYILHREMQANAVCGLKGKLINGIVSVEGQKSGGILRIISHFLVSKEETKSQK